MSDRKDPIPQLHREEFVLTMSDLLSIRNGYTYQWLKASRLAVWTRLKFLIAIGTVDALIQFLEVGKVGRTIEDEEKL